MQIIIYIPVSSDSESPMEEMIRHAISLGLKTICFTEHHDIDYPVNPDGFDFLLDLPSYKEEIFKMKEHYQDQIEINYGVELGLMPTTLDQCAAFVKDEPFDFIIGSTHIVDLWIHMMRFILKHILPVWDLLIILKIS